MKLSWSTILKVVIAVFILPSVSYGIDKAEVQRQKTKNHRARIKKESKGKDVSYWTKKIEKASRNGECQTYTSENIDNEIMEKETVHLLSKNGYIIYSSGEFYKLRAFRVTKKSGAELERYNWVCVCWCTNNADTCGGGDTHDKER